MTSIINKRIGIVGHADQGKTTLSVTIEALLKQHHNDQDIMHVDIGYANCDTSDERAIIEEMRSIEHHPKCIIIGDSSEPEYININGQMYTKIEKQHKHDFSDLLLGDIHRHYYSRKCPDVDIVKEFELIQLKSSKLSSVDRQLVINKFLKTYKLC